MTKFVSRKKKGKVGRPRKRKYSKSNFEGDSLTRIQKKKKKQVRRCKNCGESGHYAKTCNNIQEE